MRSLVLSIAAICCLANVGVNCGGLYKPCKNFPVENLEDVVKVSKCKEKICPLKKGTRTELEIKFHPDHDVTEIVNKVSAGFGGTLELPFIGVDGAVANNKVFDDDGVTPAKFPLVSDKEYIYKNGIDVLKLFPNVKVDVHWELTDSKGNTVACFEVPAKIVN